MVECLQDHPGHCIQGLPHELGLGLPHGPACSFPVMGKESGEGHEEGEIHKGGCSTLAKAPGVVVEAGVCAPPCCAHLADDGGIHPLQVHQSVVLA